MQKSQIVWAAREKVQKNLQFRYYYNIKKRGYNESSQYYNRSSRGNKAITNTYFYYNTGSPILPRIILQDVIFLSFFSQRNM